MAEKLITHPFEDIFDIESGTTLIDTPDLQEIKTNTFDLYDDKDREIEEQYQTVYNAAFNAFLSQANTVDRGGDPRFHTSHLEVANQFLSTALQAVKEKADLKYKKEKNTASSTKNITNNNLIIDRNELLKHLGELPSLE
jgi:hypothetical protein